MNVPPPTTPKQSLAHARNAPLHVYPVLHRQNASHVLMDICLGMLVAFTPVLFAHMKMEELVLVVLVCACLVPPSLTVPSVTIMLICTIVRIQVSVCRSAQLGCMGLVGSVGHARQIVSLVQEVELTAPAVKGA